MGTLQNHNTMMPESSSDKRVTNATSGKVTNASKHHKEDVASRNVNGARAGMGSDRLPQGKLDTSRVP